MDYYGGVDPLDSLIPEFDEYGRRVRKKPGLADLMPEEERKSLLAQVAGASASGMAGLGWILDTPGAMVRGLLSGGPGKALSSLVETADERVDGRELLRQYGLVGDDNNWGNWIGGLAGEIALDPLTYLNPLAILGRGATRAPARVAQKAGLLDDFALKARKAGVGPREAFLTRTPNDLIDDIARDAEDKWLSAIPESTPPPGSPFSSVPLEDVTLDALPESVRHQAFGSSLARARKLEMDEADFLSQYTPQDLISQAREDALSNFTRAAQGSGLDADSLLDQTLGAVMEARIPGMKTGLPILTGEAGRPIARAFDKLGEGLASNRYTGPLATRAIAAFDPTVMGQTDRADQWLAREAFANQKKAMGDAREELAREVYRASDGVTGELGGEAVNFNSQRVQNAIADMIEAGMDPANIANITDQSAVDLVMNTPAWRDFADWSHRRNLESLRNREAAGLNAASFGSNEGTSYLARQVKRFATEEAPVIPNRDPRKKIPYERGERLFSLDDLVGKGRREYTDIVRPRETFRRLLTDPQVEGLQQRLIEAAPADTPAIIDQAFASLGLEAPYQNIRHEGQTIDSLMGALATPDIDEPAKLQSALDLLTGKQRQLKTELGDLLRQADLQHAQEGIGLFDNSVVSDMARSMLGEARSVGAADMLRDRLAAAARPQLADMIEGGGYVPMDQALKDIGFNKNRFEELTGMDVARHSISESELNALKKVAPQQALNKDNPLTRLYDSYTSSFKVGALASPAYHFRNLYSGLLSTMMNTDEGGLKALPGRVADWWAGMRAGSGNYNAIAKRLAKAPGYEGLDTKQRIDKFLMESGRHDLGQGFINEGADTRAFIVGQGDQTRPKLYDKDRSWMDWLTVRGVDFAGIAKERAAPKETLNPLLQWNERLGKRVEDANRVGTYLGEIRRGAVPDAAAAKVAKTQIDYSPAAFTEFERKLKRFIPFYSYPRGIIPSVVENILERPGALQGRTIRAISNASRPNEDTFLPEHLRKSAAIQIPGAAGSDPNLANVISGITMPYDPVNLISPGIGGTLYEKVTDALQKTGMNFAGMLNPAVKAPLELLLDRQLYSGRELSDTYSMLEDKAGLGTLGRHIEQLLVNVPGGGQAAGIVRTAIDERLSPMERAQKLIANKLVGAGLRTIDRNKAMEHAARDTYAELLRTVPGVQSYETLNVPEEALARLSEDQRRQYMHYRIMQAEASKRARERKKAERDPLEVFFGKALLTP
jgi:hypothetical protein